MQFIHAKVYLPSVAIDLVLGTHHDIIGISRYEVRDAQLREPGFDLAVAAAFLIVITASDRNQVLAGRSLI